MAEFAAVDFAAVREALAGDTVVDARNPLDGHRRRSAGVRYFVMGVRGEDSPAPSSAASPVSRPAQPLPVRQPS